MTDDERVEAARQHANDVAASLEKVLTFVPGPLLELMGTAFFRGWNRQLQADDRATLAERLEDARARRWWSVYTTVLNARHFAGDSIPDAHERACDAATHAAGAMPEGFR